MIRGIRPTHTSVDFSYGMGVTDQSTLVHGSNDELLRRQSERRVHRRNAHVGVTRLLALKPSVHARITDTELVGKSSPPSCLLTKSRTTCIPLGSGASYQP